MNAFVRLATGVAFALSMLVAPTLHAQSVDMPAAALEALANNDTSQLEAYLAANADNSAVIAQLGAAAASNPGLATIIAYAASRVLPLDQAPAVAASIVTAVTTAQGGSTGALTISRIAGAVGAGARGNSAFTSASSNAQTATLANIAIATTTGNAADATVTEANVEAAASGADDAQAATVAQVARAIRQVQDTIDADQNSLGFAADQVVTAENPSVTSPTTA
jgi:hypothetical protein